MDTIRLYFVTWNVATKAPVQDLNSLLDFPSQFNKNKPLPDFFIIGLQEVKSQPQNLLMDSLFADPWTSAFNNVLCRQGYVIAKSIRLQGLILLVYSLLKHVTHLRDVEVQYTKTGLGGMWGNKGAVSVRFELYGCSLCLVNCHLTAHEHLLADRISDYNTILKHHEYHVKDTKNILYHDYVFWLGDLNFRTDHPAGAAPTAQAIVDALKAVEKSKFSSVLRHDQLKAVMESGEAFSEFQEPEIRFPPTYKFNIGTDEYDIKRKPSWTDRVLYRVQANNYENVTLRADLESYDHLPHYTLSDHKPIVAQYRVKIRPGKSRTARYETPKAFSMRSAMVMTQDVTDANQPGTLVDSLGDDQVFSDLTSQTVQFQLVSQVWVIGGDADFETKCSLSPDVVVNPGDWIGIYDAHFQNVDDYICYEYLSKVWQGSDAGAGAGAGACPRAMTLRFPVGSGVRVPGFYRLLYFSQPNTDVRSLLGMSEPFEVSSREGARPLSAPPVARAGPSDLFGGFTGLDVTSLSRQFSNDLSID